MINKGSRFPDMYRNVNWEMVIFTNVMHQMKEYLARMEVKRANPSPT